jgi:hypothetical protein
MLSFRGDRQKDRVIVMHKKKRSEERIPFKTTCVLDINGSKYSCLVDNISTAGALIEVDNSGEIDIGMGDSGILKVLLLSPVTYRCKVTRILTNKIGLHLVEQKT